MVTNIFRLLNYYFCVLRASLLLVVLKCVAAVNYRRPIVVLVALEILPLCLVPIPLSWSLFYSLLYWDQYF